MLKCRPGAIYRVELVGWLAVIKMPIKHLLLADSYAASPWRRAVHLALAMLLAIHVYIYSLLQALDLSCSL